MKPQGKMKHFRIRKPRDLDGNPVPDGAVVAEGVIFSSGKCVMEWLHANASVVVFDSLQKLEAVQGHLETYNIEVPQNFDQSFPPSTPRLKLCETAEP